MKTTLLGLREAKATFKILPEVLQRRLNDATRAAAGRVLAGARQRVAPHRRYGFLERYLGVSMSNKTGVAKVGLPAKIALVIPGGVTPGSGLKITRRITRFDLRGRRKATFLVLGDGHAKGARVIRPSKYAHLVEFGHRRGRGHGAAGPSPFMIPAAEAERASYLADVGQAVREAGEELARGAKRPQGATT